jgi:hypothetical protein
MANLFGENIGTNYKGILNLDTINTPLDATLRAVTDGEGNASPLQLSTDAVSLGGATGANWDNTNKRLGIGTDTPTALISIVTDLAAGSEIFTVKTTTAANKFKISYGNNPALPVWNVGISDLNTNIGFYTSIDFKANGTLIALMTSTEVRIGGGLGARLAVKGSGTTASTTALLVENSAGTAALTIKDNLSATFGGALTSSSNITTTATVQGGNINAANILYIGNYQSSIKSNGSGIIQLQNTAENDFSRLQFGGATSSFPSLKRNGTAIDVRLADDSNYAQFNTGATFIKGSGSTFATNSLLVQNSAGNDALQVRDDRVIIMVGIPTSAAGLPSGAIWNNSGVINIV